MVRLPRHLPARGHGEIGVTIKRAAAAAAALALAATGLVFHGGQAVAAAAGVITEYPIPTAGSNPKGIAAGPDGSLWFTESSTNKIAKVTPWGSFTEYVIPTASSSPTGITAGPDGNMWYATSGSGNVGKVTPSGVITEYPAGASGAQVIITGPDGNLWFTGSTTGFLGKMSTSGALTKYYLTSVYGLAPGRDGNVWFTDPSRDMVGKITTAGVVTEYPLNTGGLNSFDMTAGPDGNLWFVKQFKIGKITTSGVVTDYPIPRNATFITFGPDGKLWMTQLNTHSIASLTTSGVYTEYAIPTAFSSPWGIAAGPDGNIWFTENAANNVAKLSLVATCSRPTSSSSATAIASSTRQYSLNGSDGTTWQNIDTANLSLACDPTADQSVLLTANADLFTGKTGFNQDVGIFVRDNGGADQLLAWKESGGFAGTFSPNAAYVQDLFDMTAGHGYVFTLKWKTNRPAPGVTIFAGAGSGTFSPTSLMAKVFPTGASPNFASSNQQYSLAGSDGATWTPIDGTNLSTTLSPSLDGNAVLGVNADLWTADAGYNQDIAIFVSDNGAQDTLLAWKESGGSAGTFSPNAAFVSATLAMTGGHTYLFTVEWKTNKSATGKTIYAAAGPSGAHSPTSLFAENAATSVFSAVSTSQYTLANSDGSSWEEIDPALDIPVALGPVSPNAILGGNADLWTANAGFNQDLGIFVSDNGGADVLLAWKESGGFAGTFSPNAAFVQTTYQFVASHEYVFKLKWKTNRPAFGASIFAAAGGPAPFSTTGLTVQLTG